MKNRILQYYHSFINETPPTIRAFLRNALIVFALWKLTYLFILLDDRILDRPLTNHVGAGTVWFLNYCTPLDGFSAIPVIKQEAFDGQLQIREVSQVIHQGKDILLIADGCNGLELIVLYIGFIICFPSSILKKIIFILLGIGIIDLSNIIRCGGLVFLKRYYGYDLFQFAHHYGFKITLYSIIFMMWVLFTKNKKIKNSAI
jgi:exosortase/archaeosortase family protein